MGRFLKIGCLGLLGLVGIIVVIGVIGAIVAPAPPSSPPERAEKKGGVEQAQPRDQQAGGGQQRDQQPAQKTYQVGETARVGKVVWEVIDAFRTEQLVSTFGTRANGTFVVVDFRFTNNRDESVTLSPDLHMTLTDSQGRQFETSADAW